MDWQGPYSLTMIVLPVGFDDDTIHSGDGCDALQPALAAAHPTGSVSVRSLLDEVKVPVDEHWIATARTHVAYIWNRDDILRNIC